MSCSYRGGEIIACKINSKVTYSAGEFGDPFLAYISAILIMLGFFVLFEGIYRIKPAASKLLEFYGINSIIIMCTHLILVYGIRVIEKIIRMEMHTFPSLLAFIMIVIVETIIIKIIPSKLLFLFGKTRR